jgi:cytoskeleton protein RodZ
MSDGADRAAQTSASGPGQMLAQLRGELKLSVADVAQRLKYRPWQIEALEAEEYGKLPGGGTFVRGMVRSYAKLLDTDPQPILKGLEQRYVPGEVSMDLRAKRVPFSEGGRRSTRAYLILSILVAAAVAGVLYEWRVGTLPWAKLAGNFSPQQEPAAPPAAPRTAAPPQPAAPEKAVASPVTDVPPPAPVSTAAAGPRSEGRIQLEFESDSWVEIRAKDGQMLMSQLNPAGTRKVVVGQPPLSLVIGNAAAVRLKYNDRPVDLKPYVQIEVARLTLD